MYRNENSYYYNRGNKRNYNRGGKYHSKGVFIKYKYSNTIIKEIITIIILIEK